jgi:uncharacterized protein (TIGR02145 family)
MKKIYILAMFTIATITSAQTKKTTTASKPKQATTSKQITYQSVTVGNQVWMTKNLDVSTFRNGDPIPQAQTSPAWRKAAQEKKPAWCYYQLSKEEAKRFGNAEQCKIYGKLYNYYAVSDPRGLAPEGWQIANEKDWRTLMQYAEDNISVNSDLDLSYSRQRALSSKKGWFSLYDLYEVKQGLDLFGLNIPPAGNRWERGDFEHIGSEANLIVNDSKLSAESIKVLQIMETTCTIYEGGLDLGDGYSVRCVKAKEYEPTAQDYFNNGNTKFNAKDYNGAIEEFSKAIELSPDSFLCYYYRGNMKGWLKNWNEARIDYEKSWKLVQAQNLYNDSNVKYLLFQLGVYTQEREKSCYYHNEAVKYGSEEAKEYGKKCNEEKINDLIKSGYAKQTNKDYEGATIDFTKILDLDRNSYLAFIYKGNVKGEQNKWHDAIVDYEASWNIIKTNNLYQESSVKDLLLNLGYAYLTINNKESGCFYLNEAFKYGSEAAKQYIDKCDQERSDALLKSGILKYESKDFEGAISDFTASNVLSRNGNKGPIIFRRAESKFSLQRWEDAIKDYQRVWNIFKIGNYKDEEKSLVLFSLGKSYIQLNNLENACYFLNEAVKLKNTGAQELIDKFCNKGEIILQSEPIFEQE